MAGVNRFMEPGKAQYMQTYVSQYVPKPFELMQRAADNAQAHYDAVEKNIEDMNSAISKFRTHSGEDTQDLEALQKVYQDKLDDILQGGDLRFAEQQVRQLGQHLGENYRSGALGKYIHSGKREEEYFAANKEQKTKKIGENWSTAKEIVLADAHKRHYDTGYGGDFDKVVTTTTLGGSPNINKVVKDIGSEIKESTILDNPFYNTAEFKGYLMYLDSNYEGVGNNDAKAIIMNGLMQNEEVVEEAKMRAAVKHGGEHPSEYLDQVTDEQITAEIADMAAYGADTYSYSKRDTKANLIKDYEGEGAKKKAEDSVVNFTAPITGEKVGIKTTVDAKSMANHIEETKAQYTKEAKTIIGNIAAMPEYKEFAKSYGKDLNNIEDLIVAMNDSKFRNILKEGSPNAFKKLENLETNYTNAKLRDVEANNYVEGQVKGLTTNLKILSDTFEEIGISSTHVNSAIEGLPMGNDPKRNPVYKGALNLIDKKGWYDEYKDKPQGYDLLSFVREKADSGNKDAVKFVTNLDKANEIVSKHRVELQKAKVIKDGYLKRTAEGFAKTQGGNTVLPVYKQEEYVNKKDGSTSKRLVIDEDATDKATKSLQKLTSMKYLRTLSGAQVKVAHSGYGKEQKGKLFDDDSKEHTLGEVLAKLREKNKDVKGYETQAGLPLISKSFNKDGERFIALTLDETEIHMKLSDTNLKEVRDLLNTTVTSDYNGKDITYNPTEIDNFIYKAFNSGLKTRPLLDGKMGTIFIPRDELDDAQSNYTFFNDTNFKIVIPPRGNKPSETLTDKAAYNYLAYLKTKGLLR